MSRREAAGVALVVLGIVVAYAWSGQFWIDLVDEGYFLDLGQRVLNGELPYRDFTTYYTPGIFYLFALAFKVFGSNVIVERLVMAALRGVCALLLYVLTRRVAPWPLAWLPFAIVATFDHWPIEPEPHPSWPALAACLATLALVVRHLDSGARRWLALAGAAAGLAYLFKQNIGAFTALGLAGYTALRPGELAVGARSQLIHHVVRILFSVGTAGLVTALMWANLDPLFAGALWLPLVVTLGVLAYRALLEPARTARAVIADGTLAATGFAGVTLCWLVPLLLAIGPRQTPIGLFLGSIDQASIFSEFGPFAVGTPQVLLAAIWAPTLVLMRPGHPRWRLLVISAALTVLVFQLPIWHGPRDQLTRDPRLLPLLTWLDENFGTLHLYLPALGTWAGVVGLLALRRSGASPYPWYVLFGAFAALTMYPRADTLHSIVSSPVPQIGAAGAVALVHHGLKSETRWRRLGVIACALAVPIVAVAPQALWRVATIVSPEEGAPRLAYANLDLPRAGVIVPRQMAEDLRGVVGYVQAGTPPGEPFFAYPVAPLFNFLADRPNPTRFDHFIGGTLTRADFAEVIGDLERSKPRYVLWDHRGVLGWETDPANRPLSDYIWRCYDQVAAFRLYLVLERRVPAC